MKVFLSTVILLFSIQAFSVENLFQLNFVNGVLEVRATLSKENESTSNSIDAISKMNDMYFGIYDDYRTYLEGNGIILVNPENMAKGPALLKFSLHIFEVEFFHLASEANVFMVSSSSDSLINFYDGLRSSKSTYGVTEPTSVYISHQEGSSIWCLKQSSEKQVMCKFNM